MTIAVGQICLLIGEHSRAGETCVVVGPLRYSDALHVRTGELFEAWTYDIEVARPDEHVGQWVARPVELLPLTPPTAPTPDDVPEAHPQPGPVEEL